MTNLNKRQGFKERLKENKFVFLAFLSSALIMLLVYFCYELVPFGGKTILRMDLYHQYGPLFAELYERIVGGESLLYSWNTGLGGSFLGNFFNYLSSPLSVIILIFGHENIPEAIATMILLKASFASMAFSYYLKRSTGKNDYTITAFGVLYSFCGFFIAYYWNVMWLDAMVMLPLVAFGIERIINKGKFGLYFAALAVTMVSNYYMAFMMCIFAVLYFIVYYFSHYVLNDSIRHIAPLQRSVTNPDGTKGNLSTGKWIKKIMHESRFFQSGVRFAVGSIAAAMVTAFSLLPTYFALQACSATSGTFPQKYTSYFKIFDFLANHLASVTPTIRSSGTDVLPNVYCGVIVVILICLYLFTKTISKREKLMHVALLAFFFFSFNVNYLNYIWHAFHFPNDLPYRFSFIYSFVLLIMAYQVLIRIKEFTSKEIVCTGLAIISFIVIAQKTGSKNLDELAVILSIVLVAIYSFVLILMKDKRYQKSAVAALLLCCVLTEAAAANTDNYSMDQPKENYVSDLSDFQEVKNQLDEKESGSFYRMELTDLRTRMDPAWYNYNGVSTFSSMAYEKVANLQSKLGMFGNFINSYTYNLQTPLYNSMFGLKYIVDNSASVELDNAFYEKLPISSGVFTAYENKYYLPIAYRVNSEIKSWNYEDSNDPFMLQQDFFKLATGGEDVFRQVPISYIDYTNIDSFIDETAQGTYTFFRSTPGADASFVINLTCETTDNVYIYVKSSNIKFISVNSDSYNNEAVNMGNEYILDIGKHEIGENISVEIPIDEGDSGYVDFYAYSFDEAAFKDGYNKMKSDSLQITEFTDTTIEGTVNASADGVLYTSIPYDEGWSVTIDGQKVNEEDVLKIGDALLGISVTVGEHQIKMHYTPKGLTIGITVSFVGILLCILFLLLYRKGSDKTFSDYPTVRISAADNASVESTDTVTKNEPVAEFSIDNKIIADIDDDEIITNETENTDN